MREEIRANESVFEESITLRDRQLRPHAPHNERKKTDPAPIERSGAEEAAIEPQTESKAPQPRRETSKRRRGQADNYDEVFLKRKDLKIRQSVYISQETHASVTRLVHLHGMAGKEISVGGYIDNVVAEHMESHREFIADLRRRQLEQE
jgi:hypothetical protein